MTYDDPNIGDLLNRARVCFLVIAALCFFSGYMTRRDGDTERCRAAREEGYKDGFEIGKTNGEWIERYKLKPAKEQP